MYYKRIHSNLFDIIVCFCITIIHQNTIQVCVFFVLKLCICDIKMPLIYKCCITYYVPMFFFYYLSDLIVGRGLKYCLSRCYDFLLELSRLFWQKQNSFPQKNHFKSLSVHL